MDLVKQKRAEAVVSAGHSELLWQQASYVGRLRELTAQPLVLCFLRWLPVSQC